MQVTDHARHQATKLRGRVAEMRRRANDVITHVEKMTLGAPDHEKNRLGEEILGHLETGGVSAAEEALASVVAL